MQWLSQEDTTRGIRFAIIALAVFWGLLRFYGLEQSPPGFYIDESSAALNIICLREKGENFYGDSLPLFPRNLSNGRNSPTYMYFGVVWSALFGDSIGAFRGINALFGAIGVLGLFFLGRIWWGTLGGIFCGLAMAASPWAFQSSRVAWDAGMALGLTPWALFFLFRPGRSWNRVAAGILFSLAMYTYGAPRIQIPLLFIGFALLPSLRGFIGGKDLRLTFVSLCLTGIPLIIYTVWGAGMTRFHQVGMTTHHTGGSTWSLLTALIHNVVLHFSPNFLFAHGDENLRHSTYFFGQLGWLDIVALGVGIPLALREVRSLNSPPVLWLALVGVVTGILPAALTWDSLPHALRSSGCVPFYALCSGWLLWKASQQYRWMPTVVLVVGLFYTGAFVESYFVEYPRIAAGYYDSHIRDSIARFGARRSATQFLDENRSYHEAGLRYYLAGYWGLGCEAGAKKIEAQHQAEKAYLEARNQR